jgi:GAF domain-containing protein
VWRLETNPTRIRCLDLYERAHRRHSDGVELLESDFPTYFRALATERTIAAHDAVRDPRTSCFADSYLRPLEIEAMLDVPIWVDGSMCGVICHEHVGGPRVWNADEETFAYLMSSYVGLSLEAQRKR